MADNGDKHLDPTSGSPQIDQGLPDVSWDEFEGEEAEHLLKAARREGARSLIQAFRDPLDRERILQSTGGLCGICGGALHERLSKGRPTGVLQWDVDHTVPLARGGDHVYENLQPVHPYCNSRKRDQLLVSCGWPPGTTNADLTERFAARRIREVAAWQQMWQVTAELALTERHVHLIEQADGWSAFAATTRARLWTERLARLGRAPDIAHWWLQYPARRRAVSGQPEQYQGLIDEAKRRGSNVLNVDGVWAVGWLKCGESE